MEIIKVFAISLPFSVLTLISSFATQAFKILKYKIFVNQIVNPLTLLIGFLASYYMGWLGYSIVTSLIVHFAVLIPLFFTNAIFLDAERENAPWHFQWRQEQSSWKFWKNRPSLKGKNIIRWDLDKEA